MTQSVDLLVSIQFNDKKIPANNSIPVFPNLYCQNLTNVIVSVNMFLTICTLPVGLN